MNRCKHGSKMTLFCISEKCTQAEASGCVDCMKNDHNHNGPTLFINEQDIARLLNKFQTSLESKPLGR